MKASMPICVALASVALAACQQPPAPVPSSAPEASASTPVIPAPASAAAPASASTAPVPGDHAATRHYKIVVNLPTLPADAKPLSEAMRTTADNAKRDFVQALPDPDT